MRNQCYYMYYAAKKTHKISDCIHVTHFGRRQGYSYAFFGRARPIQLCVDPSRRSSHSTVQLSQNRRRADVRVQGRTRPPRLVGIIFLPRCQTLCCRADTSAGGSPPRNRSLHLLRAKLDTLLAHSHFQVSPLLGLYTPK